MSSDQLINPENLTKEQNAQLIMDFFHRTIMHYAMWFAEVKEHLGSDIAFETLTEVWKKSSSIQMSRIAKTLGIEIENNLPKPLMELPNESIEKLRDNMAVNWLANDGIWFQAVEFTQGMNNAKHCNDLAWGQFSPLEAMSIKKLLGLPANPGLEGLKKALQLRLYAFINVQSFREETNSSFIFQMDDCRVQNARKRKGLDDYPCKSGGLIEYTSFAESIDPRIKTECICCPPDIHPPEYFCAWKFYIES